MVERSSALISGEDRQSAAASVRGSNPTASILFFLDLFLGQTFKLIGKSFGSVNTGDKSEKMEMTGWTKNGFKTALLSKNIYECGCE